MLSEIAQDALHESVFQAHSGVAIAVVAVIAYKRVIHDHAMATA